MRNTTTSRRIPALFALSVLIALAALLSLSGDAAAQTVDYDSDNDGYIDITTHQQLNAVRHDVDANGDPTSGGASTYATAFPNRVTSSSGRMGCPSGNCTGYELMNDINLNSYSNWTPIGTFTPSTARYSGDFKGNGYVVRNLTLNSSAQHQGLFGYAAASARIESLGVINANVTATNERVGILIGTNWGEVVACYTTGSVTGTGSNAIRYGGLVGWSIGSISSSYSTASVSAQEDTGGLLGTKANTGSVTNSYSTGAVSGTKNIGGLIGVSNSGTGTVTASYWDTQTSNRSTSGAGTGQTTSGLQSLTGYSGIYAAWNANLDGQSGNDDPWDFGTSSQYPALKYGAANAADALYAQGRAAPDYDVDNDNYIDVPNHARLNAIRYDLNGNGARDSVSVSNWANYLAAFPFVTSVGIGCPGACVGYELTANINLDTNGNGSHDSADAYYNSGMGWLPIGEDSSNEFTAKFKGNGYTVQNLTVNRTSTTNVGLFGRTSNTARLESVGVTAANVTGSQYAGALVGASRGEVVACWSTGSVTAGRVVGGLVGWSPNTIHTSYSHASATGTNSQADHVGGLLGACQDCTVTNSYSTGRITRTGTSVNVGGLMGSGGAHDAPGSYWDTTTSMFATSAGSQSAVGKTTAELQNPTGYTGIYAAWNANLDGVAGNDDPWDFKGASAYPALVYHHTDYDTDEDNLIEISNLAQLNAIRWNLNGRGDSAHAVYSTAFPNRSVSNTKRMGCPAGYCLGYELVADLDFDSDGDDDVDADDHGGAYWNNGEGWVPFGQVFTQTYATTFQGNGHTIDHLLINRPAVAYQGLFRIIASNGRVESLGLTNANVTGGGQTGILAGGNTGKIVASYTTGAAVGTNSVGGITGINQGTGAEILSSYSTASVRGVSQVGGLVGRFGSGAITHAYATGAVARASGALTTFGGLIGHASTTTGITASYYDTTTSGCVSGSTTGCTGSAGGSAVVGKTTSELKSPTDYTGIYSTWSANLDGVAGNDAPWDFGTTTDYPALVYHIIVDYDADNDRYIDVANLAQLNAVRHDLNGNGDATTADYASAFPRRIGGMGCPSTGCAGYELVADLDFDSDGDGDVDASDHGGAYHNSGSGWNPIATYTSAFKGNGHTINNLFINRTSGSVGLFGRTSSARIETLGVTNANVRGGANTGILIGYMSRGAMVACYTSGKVRGGDQTGGLVGYSGFNGGAINTSYSTAYVRGGQYVGGVVGFGSNGSITNSYSTGRVDGSNDVGGLLGCSCANHTQSNNYWDTSASGRSNGIGRVAPGTQPGSSAGVTGKTTRQLQTVTTYTGIYSAWNNNLDGVSGNDDPWDLGNKMQYPMLDYKSMSTDPQGGLAMGIPDNWNAPIVGERVGVCIAPGSGVSRATVSGQTWKEPWIWERSDNGDTWETVSGITAPTYEYAPTTSDVNHYLRAKVKLADGTFAYTRALGGRVKNASGATAGTAISFRQGNTSPRVGELIIANDPRPSGAVDARFAWQRCDNADMTYTDCEYIVHVWWTNYTPVADDLNKYLRMVVYYETSGGVWTRHATAFTGQVAAASQ